MRGIVDPNSEDLRPYNSDICCILPPYLLKLRKGNELWLMVGLSIDESVNFIIRNAWLKQNGAVIEFGANFLQFAIHEDINRFEFAYQQPMKTISKMDGGGIATHKAALKTLLKMIGILDVINVFDNGSLHI